MSWISNITPPGIKKMFKRQDDTPDVLWVKCPSCSDMIFHRDLEAALNVCPSCNHHMRIGPKERFTQIFDGPYQPIELPEAPADPLKFKDEKKYTDRLRDARFLSGV
ncbi:MAG: acetyl-CoA carboxylase carboxyl transferase subunit beta, partial [Pseudomonadota bacterium]